MSAAGASGGTRWPLALTYAGLFAVPGVLMPFLPPFLAASGLGAVDIGLALAAMTTARIVAPPLWATLADRLHARLAVVRLGLVGGGVMLALLAVVPSGPALTATLVAYAALNAAVLPQVEALTLVALGTRAGDYGRVRLWGSVGFIVSALAGGVLVEASGPATLPVLATGFQLLALLATLTLPAADSGRVADGDAAGTGAVRWRPVAAFLVYAMLISASHGPYYGFFSIHMEALGYGESVIGVFWALAVLAEIALFAVMPGLLVRVGLRALFVVCALATGTRWLLTGFLADWLAVLLLAQALHAVSFGLFHGTAMHFLRRAFPPAMLGRGQSLYAALGFGAGSAIGAAAGGALFAGYGAGVAFAAAALACLLAALVVVVGVERDAEPEDGSRAAGDRSVRSA